MTLRIAFVAVLLAAGTGVALAEGTAPRPSMPSGGQPEIQASPAVTARQQAEQYYGDAYNDIAKARQDLAAGKAKNAEKKLQRALDRASRATDLDSTYHEAWNLVGFASRKLGAYPRSLGAYARCLRLKPDDADAREYLGEAYVELGRLREAREQLSWLERLKADERAATLRTAIEQWQAAHPDRAAAAADSTSG